MLDLPLLLCALAFISGANKRQLVATFMRVVKPIALPLEMALWINVLAANPEFGSQSPSGKRRTPSCQVVL